MLKQPAVISVAEKLDKTPAQVCLRWGIQMGQSVLPKSTHEARIKENLDVLNWSIPDDLLAKFSEIPQVNPLIVMAISFDITEIAIVNLLSLIILISNLKSANRPRNWPYIFSEIAIPVPREKIKIERKIVKEKRMRLALHITNGCQTFIHEFFDTSK